MTTTDQEIELSVVIPVFNAEQTLRDLLARLLVVLSSIGKRFEIIMVNDGSRDDSWRILRELQDCHQDELVVIDLMRNFGQHNALMCGLRNSRGALVITMDDDLQNPPEEIDKLIQCIEHGTFDLVYGYSANKRHGLWRNLGSELTQRFYRAIFRRKNRVSSYRIIKRTLVESVLSYDRTFTYLDGLFAWNTDRIGEVNVDHHVRRSGRSGYSLKSLLTLALNLFTNFSLVPLQIVSSLGFIVAFGGGTLRT